MGHLKRFVKPDLPSMLKKLESIWNSSHVSRTTGLTPDETTDEKAPAVLWERRKAEARAPRVKRAFEIGDKVLIKKPSTMFGKSDEPRFYQTIYEVAGVKRASPNNRYHLVNQQSRAPAGGTFSTAQLASTSGYQPTMEPRKETVPEPIATRTRAKLTT
ncbi:MAG: hypothetical protein GY738_14135, partial [Pseudoalteromonas sp.]|nr:hypothetical protein [Pseudoalteromonas sp.]